MGLKYPLGPATSDQVISIYVPQGPEPSPGIIKRRHFLGFQEGPLAGSNGLGLLRRLGLGVLAAFTYPQGHDFQQEQVGAKASRQKPTDERMLLGNRRA